jgi:hypothetical protein
VPDEDSAVDFYRLSRERARQEVGERRSTPMQPSDRPVRTIPDPDYSFASLLSFLESRNVAHSEPAPYADFLLDLVEFEGGGWALFEPSEEMVIALSPDRYREQELMEWYEADGESELPRPGRRMLEWKLCAACLRKRTRPMWSSSI